MIEILILSVGLLILIGILMRRGAARLETGWVFGVFMAYGIVLGVLIEGMPFSAVAGRPSIRTFVAAMVGVFALRLLARGVRGWARGYRDEDRGSTREDARLLHPIIAFGLALSGILMIHEACVSRHMALEIENTPRSGTTGIVRGAEPISLTQENAASRAILLFHGFLGSPADFGDLPETLHEAGFTVQAPLLPGHGTTPAELRSANPDEWLEAALAAYDALVETHPDVTVLGFSMGGFVATQVANERDVKRLVLINPFVGETFQPAWSPIPTDDLAVFFEPLIDSVIRPSAMVRLRDQSQVPRMRTYKTVPITPVVRLHEAAQLAALEDDFRWVPCPTLVLLSDGDHVTPSDSAHAIYDAPDVGPVDVESFAKSDHLLLLDYDRDEAVAKVIAWVSGQ